MSNASNISPASPEGDQPVFHAAPPQPPREPSAAERAHHAAVEQFPYVALTVAGTGIHPASSRLITLDAVTFNAHGELGGDKHFVFNPDADPGPWHQHGLTREEVAQGLPFSNALRSLDRLIDGRTLIVHDTPLTWGFIVAEARRAMTAAARANRARSRGRNNRRRRTKVGHIPKPLTIVDTLDTARRREVVFTDKRLAAVAIASGLRAPGPEANTQRGKLPEVQTSRDLTHLLRQLYAHQVSTGDVTSYAPDELRADKFGLQRSHVRIDAQEAPRMHHNPGTYQPGKELVRGMEFVVAPEVGLNPDDLIAAGVREELNYSEKLTRDTSFVVCNMSNNVVGKPMHAQRKGIPLLSDVAFLAALERIAEPGPEPESLVPPSRRTAPRRLSPRPNRRNNSRRKNQAAALSSPTERETAVEGITPEPSTPDNDAGTTTTKNPRRRRRRRPQSAQRQGKPQAGNQRSSNPSSGSQGEGTQNADSQGSAGKASANQASASQSHAHSTSGDEPARSSTRNRKSGRRGRGRRGGRNRNSHRAGNAPGSTPQQSSE